MKKSKDDLERKYLKLIELEDGLIYLQENQDYVIKNIEIFQKLIEDRYENEKEIKLTDVKVYESVMEKINNLINYLEESEMTYEKELERVRLGLNNLKSEYENK